MNLHLLSVKMMLNTSARWLESEAFVSQLLSVGGLGESIHAELKSKHEALAELAHRRNLAHERVRELIELCGRLDETHDRKARALHMLLEGLIEASDDPAEIGRYRKLLARLFPIGLRVVRLPFIEEGGAAVELERSLSAEAREQLGAITVGSQQLEQVLDAWLAAGHQLGEAVRQRAELQAALGRDGSAAATIDLRVGRKGWLQAVRGLRWAIEVRPELHSLEEPVMAALGVGIKTELRRRGEVIDEGEWLEEVEETEDEAAGELEETEDEAAGELEDQAPDELEPADAAP